MMQVTLIQLITASFSHKPNKSLYSFHLSSFFIFHSTIFALQLLMTHNFFISAWELLLLCAAFYSLIAGQGVWFLVLLSPPCWRVNWEIWSFKQSCANFSILSQKIGVVRHRTTFWHFCSEIACVTSFVNTDYVGKNIFHCPTVYIVRSLGSH